MAKTEWGTAESLETSFCLLFLLETPGAHAACMLSLVIQIDWAKAGELCTKPELV